MWHLEKERSSDIETLAIDTVLNKEHFCEKNHAENVHQKLVPDSFFIFVNTQNNHCMQEIHVKISILKGGLSKTFKKVSFIFSFQPSPF